jgi:outer membrane protein TolC
VGLAESVRLQLRYRTEERLARLAATQTIAGLYDKGIIPQARMSVDAAVANYQSGKVPFVAVLEALTTLYNDRAAHLSLLTDHARARASLEEAGLEETGGAR